MLWVAAEKLRQYDPSVRIAVEPSHSTFQQRGEYGLYSLAPPLVPQRPRRLPYLIGPMDAASHLVPRTWQQAYGLVRRSQVDALVDISGYAFGDKWNPLMSRAMAARLRHFRRRKKPTVLLPQMFGPFEKPASREAFEPVLQLADLIYAREQASREWLERLNKSSRKIGLAPDITIFCDPLPPDAPPAKPYACLVPNMRMRDKAAETWGGDYDRAMVEAAKALQQHGIQPYVVIHDGGGEDLAVGQEIAEQASLSDEFVYRESDPRKIKGFIAGARMLIGSRFHALVASLSTATPAIALGWAHKYEHLLQDFGVSDYCASHTEGVAGVLERIERLADPAINEQVSEELKRRKASMQVQNDQMWDEVLKCLNLSPQG